jgi:signal transduction histidine kinase
MERLIEDMLAYARAGRVTSGISLVDPARVIRDVLDEQPPDHRFTVATSVTAVPFETYGTPLETALRNLISNAFKHHDRPDGHLTITVVEEGPFCVLTVADDGPGIPLEASERVFKLFQTLSGQQKGGGSGIGLALVKRLIESHGGRIILTGGETGRGAIFTFWWPRFVNRSVNEGGGE